MAAGNPFNSSVSSSPKPSASSVVVPWERVEGFVGQLIHDVRNGLNAIELQLTFLGEISTDPEALDEVKRLRGTLLDVTRQLQTTKTICSPVSPGVMEYPAADFFEDLHERLLRQHPGAAQTVAWNVDTAATGALLVDPDLSINGLLELFNNAFRSASSNIRCSMASEASRFSFILEETPSAALSIPPDRWGREPLLTSRRHAYGLGLFRVRRILETQGGALQAVYSEAANLLTTTASFPRPTSARGQEEVG